VKIFTIVGARPQFIKTSAIRAYNQSNPLDSVVEIMVHTGQHFDDTMSNVFFVMFDASVIVSTPCPKKEC
jgi:UDP-N-acetylglucosamine 2-epimerase